MPYAPELRSLRPDIQGAPRIRMGGPTEQYRRSRGQQKSFGLGQLYPQRLQGPQITGWKPGPLQLDPIRRVTETREPDEEEQLERYRQRLRTQKEVEEEFAAPVRKEARKGRLRREFIEEQDEAEKLALEARKREEKQRQESVKRGNLAQILHPLLIESGMSQQDANVAATQAVIAGRAEDEIERLRKQKADIAETEAKRLRGEARTGGALKAAELAGAGQQPTPEQQRLFLETGARTPAGLVSEARGLGAAERKATQQAELDQKLRERNAEWQAADAAGKLRIEDSAELAAANGDVGAQKWIASKKRYTF